MTPDREYQVVPQNTADYFQSVVPLSLAADNKSLIYGSVESGHQIPSLTCKSGDTILSLAPKPSGDFTGTTPSPEGSSPR